MSEPGVTRKTLETILAASRQRMLAASSREL